MRLKQTRVRNFILRTRTTTKDREGAPIVTYGAPKTVRGEIWPATSRKQVEQYGDRISGIQNMRLEGDYKISDDGQGITVTFSDGTLLKPGDGIHVFRPYEVLTLGSDLAYTDPDYYVLSITQYYPLKLEVEALV